MRSKMTMCQREVLEVSVAGSSITMYVYVSFYLYVLVTYDKQYLMIHDDKQ